ncbi:OprD family outer membrane porin [Mixta tenebrionis]|uniref:OprD family porin n=1 Tax=Mixta tenebrionis TaxID=2562439 RepID=A0A506V725_9GAMM|nr:MULTISPECIES: OprD family outer membrane porin [Mixta]QHM76233.1 Chitoporin [Mixta theicola]TPW41160.1 OprD family porin [Mixta tenebrionis]
MRTLPGKRKAACCSAAVITALSAFITPPARATGFIEDSTLKGAVYYWQRQRDRKEADKSSEHYGKYQENLHHATLNSSLDFNSGYAGNIIGLDLAVFGAVEMSNSGPAAPNEIGFSRGKTRWDEDWSGDRSGTSVYKAALKLQADDYWLRAGYIQPQGQTLLAPHWSFLPGTYRGVEAGLSHDYAEAGKLEMSYMWSDRYKAPWYRHTYRFRQADGKTGISWLHAVGARYDFKNKLILEGSWGQAADYMDQYFAKASWSMPLGDSDLRTSYQFYGARDRESGGANNSNDVYDGMAWLQALTFGYTWGPFDWRLEGSWVKAEGNQGFFLQRMTPSYASSNGRLDIWWDARSDWNANGEKAVFAGVMYDLSQWDLAGWTVGASWAYGWDAKPGSNPQWDQSQRIRESAWNLDLIYTIQQGRAKDTLFKLHFTRYDNHSDIPSFGGGYGNMFQDEKDVKFIVIAPFTIF